MFNPELLIPLFVPVSILGGIGVIIAANGWAKAEQTRAGRKAPQDSTVLTELQEMKQQIAEMQSTSHQFDLSFDAALSRLEDRVNQVETKTAAVTTTAPTEIQTLQNGYRP